jgi:hypothetical protein
MKLVAVPRWTCDIENGLYVLVRRAVFWRGEHPMWDTIGIPQIRVL